MSNEKEKADAPTPTKCVPISMADYWKSIHTADDSTYRFTTVSPNPLTEFSSTEVQPGVNELKTTAPKDSPAAYANTYEMPLWAAVRLLMPWINRDGSMERLIHVERIGKYK